MRHGVGVLGLSVLVACNGGGGGNNKVVPPGGDIDAAIPPVSVDAPPDGAGSGSGSGSDVHLTGIGGPPVGSCSGDWCWVLPVPQGRQYTSVWASAHGNVWATTVDGLFHYDGTTWSQYNPSDGWAGGTLWGTSADDLWIDAPNNGVVGIYHWNGTGWDLAHAGGYTMFGQTGATSFWASNGAAMVAFDGTTWTDRPLPSFTPLAIGGSGGTAIAVSNTGTIAQWLGAAWGTTGAGTHPCNAAAVIDSTHVVVAQNGDVAFWSAGTWTLHTPPVIANWDRITARSASDVWIEAYGSGAGYRYHWNGTTWTAAADPVAGVASTMWETTTGDLVVGTDDAEIRMWSAGNWSPVTIATNRLQAVWGTAPDDIWTIDYGGVSYHWDGTAWTGINLPPGYWTMDVWGSGPSDYWIAAGRSVSFSVINRALLHWDGSSWTTLEGLGTENGVVAQTGFVAIWGSGPNDIYAAGRSAVYHRDATGWSLVTAVTGTYFTDVFGTSATDVYIVDGSHLWHYDGTWTMKTTPAPITGGLSLSTTDIWLADTYSLGTGALMHYDGTFFVDVPSTGTSHSGALFGKANEIFTLNSNVTTEWTGDFASTPTQHPPQLEAYMRTGWVAPDGHIWAAGRGLIVHKE